MGAFLGAVVASVAVSAAAPPSADPLPAQEPLADHGTLHGVRKTDYSQTDLVLSGKLPLRLSGSTKKARDIVATLDGRSIGTAHPAGRATLRLKLTQPGRDALAQCGEHRIGLRLRFKTKKANVGLRVLPTPPNCARFFDDKSVWNTPLPPDYPVDPKSTSLVSQLIEKYNAVGATINVNNFSAPVVVVGPYQARAPVILDRSDSSAHELAGIFAQGAPIPVSATPAGGTDSQLVVWQPSTDTMWEMQKAHRVGGAWHAGWGARMEGVSKNPGVNLPNERARVYGATATALPVVGGMITLGDLQRGRIDHALQLAIPKTRAQWFSFPARRTDGNDTNAGAIPEGSRFRLPADLDITALNLPTLVDMMARAAQQYGIVIHDKSAALAFGGQDPIAGDPDAWSPYLKGTTTQRLLAAFPWSRLQVIAMHQTTRTTKTTFLPFETSRPACQLLGITCAS